MRPLTELIDTSDPALPLIREWVAGAKNLCVLHAGERSRCETVLNKLQVTTKSTLGAVAFETGGISIDHGWLRFLGGGSVAMPFDLGYEWGGDFIVAYDAVGGFFALRGTSSFYLAPETLEWRDLERGYTDLLHFTLYGDLAAFYGHVRWPGWEQEVEALPGDRAFSFYPPLYSQEGKDPAKCSRRAVPVTELWSLHSSGF